MTTWEERMADAAFARREAAEAAEREREAAEEARLDAEFPALPGEDGVLTDPPYFVGYEHKGHRTHWHGPVSICSCGAVMGVVCFIPEPDAPPSPPCPVCIARGLIGENGESLG